MENFQAMDSSAAFTVDSLMTNREQNHSYPNSRLHSSGGMYTYCHSGAQQYSSLSEETSSRYSPWCSPETSPESAASAYRNIIFDNVPPSCQLSSFRHSAVPPSPPQSYRPASTYYHYQQADCVGQKY